MIRVCSIISVSALGFDSAVISHAYANGISGIIKRKIGEEDVFAAPLDSAAELALHDFISRNPTYKSFDRTVQLAVFAADLVVARSGWNDIERCIVNASSSRGATEIWEKDHTQFIYDKSVPVKTSPMTTLGNISSSVARHLKSEHASIEHSITCGSGLQALANAVAWIKSGMADKAVVVASEAPLTGFTVAQMKALGIYANGQSTPMYFGEGKSNGMVLGEGAVAVCIENCEIAEENDLIIDSIGFGLENLNSLTSINPDGIGFQQSMRKVIQQSGLPEVIVGHFPGTIKGDLAERKAITTVFEKRVPAVVGNKWFLGHTLGASGLMNFHLGTLLLQGASIAPLPYPTDFPGLKEVPLTAIINAMGFGGNAVSVGLCKY